MPADSYPKGIDREDEKAHYDVFARLRVITDWPGFLDQQRERRQWLRYWLEDNTALSPDQLDEAKPVNVCQLPSMDKGEGKSGAQEETCMIAEREAWWNHDDLHGEWMQDAKKANRDWLEHRRQQVHGEHPDRWEYLSVATKHDGPWEDWSKKHNTTTGEKKKSTTNTRHKLSEHFIVEEFDCNDGTKCGSREYSGLEYLCKTFLEPLRDAYGTVTINSGFRTPSYNAGVGGESNSFHIYTYHDGDDQAADITCAKGTPSQWHSKLNAIRQNQRGGKGGLGLYSTFVHIDIRDYPADWRG